MTWKLSGRKTFINKKITGGENGKFNKTNAWQELSVVHYKPPIIKTDTSQLDQGAAPNEMNIYNQTPSQFNRNTTAIVEIH